MKSESFLKEQNLRQQSQPPNQLLHKYAEYLQQQGVKSSQVPQTGTLSTDIYHKNMFSSQHKCYVCGTSFSLDK